MAFFESKETSLSGLLTHKSVFPTLTQIMVSVNKYYCGNSTSTTPCVCFSPFLLWLETATDTLSQLLTAAHQQIAKEAFGTKEIERQVEEEDNEGGREKPQNWTEMEDGEKREEGEEWLEMKARKPYKKF